MGAPLRRSKKKTVVIILIVALISIAVVFLLSFVKKGIKEKRFNSSIRSLEEKHIDYASHDMLPFLRTAVDNCGDLSEAKRIIKPLFHYAETGSDYETAFGLCRRLSDSYPHNEKLAAFTVQAGLLCGAYQKSFSIANERLSSILYRDLLLETFIRSHKIDKNSAKKTSSSNPLLENHPLFSLNSNGNPDKYREVYQHYRDKRFILNAIMLLVGESKYEVAIMFLKNYSLDKTHPELYSEILYDRGAIVESRKALRRLSADRHLSPQLMLFQADLHLLERNFKEAELYYEQLIYTDPEFSANPFINLAYIREIDIKTLEKGLRYHPHSDKLKTALIKSYMLTGESEKAEKMLEEPSVYKSAELALLRKQLLEKPIPVERYETSLWKLVTDFPENTDIKEYLAWFLASREDLEGLQRLIIQSESYLDSEESVKPPLWRLFYSSWLSAVKGNTKKAISGFSKIIEGVKPDNLYDPNDVPVREAELNYKLLSNSGTKN